MASFDYNPSLQGEGVGQGLPVRRASSLYNTDWDLYYPTALDLGAHPDVGTGDRAGYYALPYLPITFTIPMHINNPRNGGRNFTRERYYVVKRGQPLMAAQKREASIGLFLNSAGTTEATRTFNDPARFADPTLAGYRLGGVYIATADSDTDGIATDQTVANDLKTTEEYNALSAPNKANYRVDNTVYQVVNYNALDEKFRLDARGVYENTEDTNTRIVTGGVDLYATVQNAVFGTNEPTYVEVDTDAYFFGSALKMQGFIFPSSGGADRVVYFTNKDTEARVVLPKGATNGPRLALEFTGSNYDTGTVIFKARPTIGIAHTDLEQVTSHQYHRFQTGVYMHQPIRKGILTIPFIDIVKAKAVLEEGAPNEVFAFTNTSDSRSGIKVGVFNNPTLAQKKAYSMLTQADAGYANLYFNFPAPFMVTRSFPEIRDLVVPDLFGNYALSKEAQAVVSTSTALSVTDFAAEVAAATTAQRKHLVGHVTNVYDVPRTIHTNLAYNPNPAFAAQNLLDRDFLTKPYARVAGAESAGITQPILQDFLFMLLGGAMSSWASQMLPTFGGLPQDISRVAELLVIKGAVGLVEVQLDTIL